MSKQRVDTRWLWTGAAVVFILGAAAAHISEDLILMYPLDTWRMDLDDAVGNFGTFLVGVAALLGLRRVGKRVEKNGKEAELLERREARDFEDLKADVAGIKATLRLL